MRARWLKPEFFTDKKVGQMDPVTAIVYEALWCWADDGGTAECDPELLKAQVFFRWSAITVPGITGALRHLSELGRISVYTVGDDIYAKIVNWERHQAVHKPSKFRYPDAAQGVAVNSAALVPGGSGCGVEIPNARHLDSQIARIPEGDKQLLSKSKQTEANASRVPRGEGKPTWLTPICEKWESRNGAGTFAGVAGQAAKALAPLHKAGHQPAEIATRLGVYMSFNEAKYWNLAKFAATYDQWAMQPIVVNGEFTAFGERLTRP